MRSILPLLVMVVGALIPQAAVGTVLIRYSVMIMLFLSFLGVNPKWSLFRWSHLWILIANATMGLLWFLAVWSWNSDYALLAFLTGIMPTAAVAPVIAGLLRQSVGYVTLALVLTNLGMALLIPWVLPWLTQGVGDFTALELLGPVSITVLLPMLAAQTIRLLAPRWQAWLLRGRDISFWLFLFNVFVAVSWASAYLQEQSQTPWSEVGLLALLVVAITAGNFGVGYWLESPGHRGESSLALGRKNTMFAVWVAVSFLPPLTVLGPIFYVVTHNVWHSWLLSRRSRRG